MPNKLRIDEGEYTCFHPEDQVLSVDGVILTDAQFATGFVMDVWPKNLDRVRGAFELRKV
jgi:hypothetical protein